jgi:pimeloyl-ACP methyl ester carboxylesterase
LPQSRSTSQAPTYTPTQAVVLIHGIWMPGLEMSLLARRLQHCGFRPYRFSYPSLRCDLADNALRLQQFVQKIDVPEVHFVAHSLGGLLVRQFFHDFPNQRTGRVVTLGTPHTGSQVARRMGSNPFGKMLLGQSFRSLRGDVPPWTAPHEIGVIAGSVSLGVGRLTGNLSGPNDGAVSVQETMLAGMSAHQVFPLNHAGLIFSKAVAKAVCCFLRTGQFS